MRTSFPGAVGVVLASVLLSGCSSGATIRESPDPVPATSGPTASATGGGARGGPEPSAAGFAPVPMGEPTLQQAAPPRSGGDVASSTYTVQQYVDFVVKSTDTYWTSWFTQGYRLREPYVFYDVVEPTEPAYQTTCTNRSGQIAPPAPHDYPNAFYCPVDTGAGAPDRGVIVLPATTLQKMWTGDILGLGQSQAVGDFAAAYVVSHEFGHHVADEFATQLAASGQKMPQITGKNNELLADCFSGLWINYAFSQGVLTDTDYQEALGAAVVVADQPGQITDDPHGSPEERVYAVRLGAELGANGYAAGNPGACTSVYWQ